MSTGDDLGPWWKGGGEEVRGMKGKKEGKIEKSEEKYVQFPFPSDISTPNFFSSAICPGDPTILFVASSTKALWDFGCNNPIIDFD